MKSHEILGVSPNAEKSEIKSAYKKLVKKYHPDVNPDAKDKFTEIQSAYDDLMEDKPQSPFMGNGDFPNGFDLNSIFGNFRQMHRQIQVPVEATLDEFYNGFSRVIFIMNSMTEFDFPPKTDPRKPYPISTTAGNSQVTIVFQFVLTDARYVNGDIYVTHEISAEQYLNDDSFVVSLLGKDRKVSLPKPFKSSQKLRINIPDFVPVNLLLDVARG